MIKFPLYVVREYRNIFTEGCFKIIETNKNRYVIDLIDSSIPTYSKRRIKLLGMEKPYDMYHINHRFDNYSQLVLTKKRLFLDAEGTLVKWKPKKFYAVESYRINDKWTTPTGKTGISVRGVPAKFIVKEDLGFRYVRLINMDGIYLLFDASYERRDKTRKKL